MVLESLASLRDREELDSRDVELDAESRMLLIKSNHGGNELQIMSNFLGFHSSVGLSQRLK